MNHRFTTILDQYAPRKKPSLQALAEAAAAWKASGAGTAAAIPEAQRCLLDPLLLAGLCVLSIERDADEAVLNLSLNRGASGGMPDEMWSGPVRLLVSGVRSIECSKGAPGSIGPKDPVVWAELHSAGGEETPLAIVLRFGSNLRLRIEARSIRFASMGLPC